MLPVTCCTSSPPTDRSSTAADETFHISSTLLLGPHNTIACAFKRAPGKEHDTHMEAARPRRLRMVHLGDDLSGHVRVVERLLSPTECKALIDEAAAHGFSRPGQFDASTRDCKRLHTIDSEISCEMMHRLRGYLPEIVLIDGARFQLHRFTHHWRYVKYDEGGHFRPHYDGAKMMPYEISCFTVQIYLNDDFEGGKTRFYMDYDAHRAASHDIEDGKGCHFHPTGAPTHAVSPATGSALIFSHVNNVLHDGEPVRAGVKYIMRGDVLYSAVPEDIPILQNPTLPPDQLMFCESTALRRGTRNFVGQVWLCACGVDGHGKRCYEHREDTLEPRKEVPVSPVRIHLVLISGKRACGKDHVADMLQEALSEKGLSVSRVALGSINKQAYANATGVDLSRLLTDRQFKEMHRSRMVEFHAQKNTDDPEWCLAQVWKAATEAEADVLLLSDLRTNADLDFFRRKARMHGAAHLTLVRVDASDDARIARGWVPDCYKDARHTEVELDTLAGWSACVDNSDNSEVGHQALLQWISHTALPRILMPHSH